MSIAPVAGLPRGRCRGGLPAMGCPRAHALMTDAAIPLTSSTPPAPGEPWSCPFCALACDDLDRASSSAGPGVETQCARAKARIAGALAGPAASVALRRGQPCSVDEACDAAAALLGEARQPMIGGLGAEVHGLRALMQLATGSQAIVDHAHGQGLAAVLTAMQDRGSYTTTIGEIRTRADLVMLVGPFDAAGFPRLAERLGLPGADGRAVVTLGHPGLAGVATEDVPLEGDLYDSVATLNAALAGRPVPPASAGLVALATRLLAARYVAVVWAPGALPPPQPTLLVEGLHRLVKLLNRRTRAGALMLAGPDAALTAQQVMTWRSGLPLRSAFHPAGLHHEPHRYGLATLAGRGAVDALLWVSAFDEALLPPAAAASLPTVLLGHPAMANSAAAKAAEVYIATAVPGIHAGGHLTRTDVVVTVPLFPLVASTLPDVATLATAIARRLPARAVSAREVAA